MASQSIGGTDPVRRDPLPMLTSLPVSLLVGTLLGFLSGLGVGGGSLLVLWLTLVTGTDPQAARSINLLFFLPSATVSTLIHRKQGTLELKKILPAMVAGSVSAFIFSRISTDMDTEFLGKCFGFLLLAAGIKELLYRPRKAR